MTTIPKLLNTRFRHFQTTLRSHPAKMQNILVKGKGPLDHASINKAAEFPGAASGQCISIAPVTLPSPGRLVPLQMRITAPVTGSNLPIMLLSHGHGPSFNLSSLQGYIPAAQFYAAHGFVVFQPTHLSSRALGLPTDTPNFPMFWRSRVDDMTNILDHLPELETAVPFLSGRLDPSRVVAWGHSMGSHTAGALAGLRVAEDGHVADVKDPRVKLAVFLGGLGSPGSYTEKAIQMLPEFGATDFSHMDTPMLVVAGDGDDSAQYTTKGWRMHADAYEMSPGKKDLLVLRGGGHMLGGLSGFDATDATLGAMEESPEMLQATLRLTLAYMRSMLYEGDSSWEEARKILEETKLGYIESK